MLRFYLKFFSPFFMIFAAALMLIHTQPYDDQNLSGLRRLFVPENCAMPCFMGIQPGLTRVDEAVQLLSRSEWVNHIRVLDDIYQHSDTDRLVEWDWTGKQPNWIKSQDAEIFGYANQVTGITIQTSVRLMDMMLLLGLPPREDIYHYLGGGSYTSIYPDVGITTYSLYTCPVTDPLNDDVDELYFMSSTKTSLHHAYASWRDLDRICR